MQILGRSSELKKGMVYKIIENTSTDDLLEFYARYTERTSYHFIFEPIDGSKKIKLTRDSYVKEGRVTLSKGRWVAYEIDPEKYPEYYI
jgi:hypothetical protein